MFLGGGIGVAGLVGNVLALSTSPQGKQGIAHASSRISSDSNSSMGHMTHMGPMAASGVPTLPFTGKVNPALNRGYDPSKFMTQSEKGTVQQIRGKSTRVFNLVSNVKKIVVGIDDATKKPIVFEAWLFNDQVPGPTLRVKEGENVLINYTNNTPLPHSIHFHGIHNAGNDGSLQAADPGQKVTYQFIANPSGLMAYHCHVLPTITHLAKGLYGAMIIDPTEARAEALELVMIMQGFPIRTQHKNDVYTFNTVANHYNAHPVEIPLGQLVRIYLVNMVCASPAISFHLHANLFKLFPSGTTKESTAFVDVVTLGLLERHVLEFTFDTKDGFTPGAYMFHSHDDPGEMGMFGLFNVLNTKGIPGSSVPAGSSSSEGSADSNVNKTEGESSSSSSSGIKKKKKKANADAEADANP
jgi:hypothetical protein